MTKQHIEYQCLDVGEMAIDCETILHLNLKDGDEDIRITLRAPYGKLPTYEVGLEKKTKA